MTQTVKVLCARCRVPLQGPDEPEPNDRVACPSCGQGDTLEAVTAEVSDYVEYMAAEHLGKMTEETFRGTPFVAVTRSEPSPPQWRFIADVEF